MISALITPWSNTYLRELRIPMPSHPHRQQRVSDRSRIEQLGRVSESCPAVDTYLFGHCSTSHKLTPATLKNMSLHSVHAASKRRSSTSEELMETFLSYRAQSRKTSGRAQSFMYEVGLKMCWTQSRPSLSEREVLRMHPANTPARIPICHVGAGRGRSWRVRVLLAWRRTYLLPLWSKRYVDRSQVIGVWTLQVSST